MSELTLTKTRIADGVYEGRIMQKGAGLDTPPPAIRVTFGDASVPGAELEPVDGTAGLYLLRVPIPRAAMAEGAHCFLIADDDSGATLGEFTIALGLPLEDDLYAEIAQLRAELDLLKRAFRKHCVETM